MDRDRRCPLAISYVVYYSHFHDVYARTLSRVGSEGAKTSLVATLSEHSESKPVTMIRFLLANYGWPALALSVVGVAAALRRGWRDGWTLVLLAVGAAVVAFLVLGAALLLAIVWIAVSSVRTVLG